MPHFIRLRGPWNWQAVGRWTQNSLGEWQMTPSDLPKGGVVTLPGDWSGALGEHFRGSVRFTRSFRCPPALADATQVLLGIEDVDWRANLELNDQTLGEISTSRASEGDIGHRCPVQFDITRLLRPSNSLSVTLTSHSPDVTEGRSGYLGLVRLEIQ